VSNAHKTDQSFPGDVEALYAEIEQVSAASRANRTLESERRLLQLRHRAGVLLAHAPAGAPEYPVPSTEPLPSAEGLPDLSPGDLSPPLLRAAILRDGCTIVRGLVDRDVAAHFARQVARAFDERERKDGGQSWDARYYDEFRPEAPYRSPLRPWIKKGGGLLVADSPMLAFDLMETFDSVGVPRLVAGYIGEPVALSVDKSTFRKVAPTVDGAWHQDGSFMGSVRSLNLWLCLSHCGDDAPGLDIVPRRLDGLVPTGTEGTFMADQVSQATAEAAAGQLPIVRPIFEPGDAVFFDDLCLHQTASDPSMQHTRYAIESWFFGASGFPDAYAPIAVAG
jgi:hypothetical protein